MYDRRPHAREHVEVFAGLSTSKLSHAKSHALSKDSLEILSEALGLCLQETDSRKFRAKRSGSSQSRALSWGFCSTPSSREAVSGREAAAGCRRVCLGCKIS